MKLALIFSSLIVLSIPAYAIRPVGMYHPKAIASQLNQSKTHQCTDRFKIKPDDLSMYSFSATIDCQYQCKSDSAVQTVEISRYFNPESHQLQQGDGYVSKKHIHMASFSAVFFNWSTHQCLEQGIRKCGSLDRVKTADFKKISSGNWSIAEKPSCKNDHIVFSPYDEQFKLNTSKETIAIAQDAVLTIPRAEEKKDCQFPIKGKVCYGDCMMSDDHPDNPTGRYFPETLMTKESGGDSEYEVCGDTLLDSFKDQTISPSVAESICQNYYMLSLVKKKEMGTSCSAFRGQANCSKFIKKMSKKNRKNP